MRSLKHYGYLSGLCRWLSGIESTCSCRRCQRCGFDLRLGDIYWSRKWLPTPVFLPGESHGQRSLWATVHGVAKSQMPLSNWALPFWLWLEWVAWPLGLHHVISNPCWLLRSAVQRNCCMEPEDALRLWCALLHLGLLASTVHPSWTSGSRSPGSESPV